MATWDSTGKMSAEVTTKSKKLTANTAKKYVDKDIIVDISVPGMNLSNSQTFYINDGIYTWNWTVDGSGNVTIT